MAFRPTPAEVNMTLPGDDLITIPILSATHAVTIAAPSADIWPWLVQMGADRAGWYSYDRLDNGGVSSARQLRSELQSLARGDVMPALPGARDAFIVADFEPQRFLILDVPMPDGSHRATWVFVLQKRSAAQTRLLVRARLNYFLLPLPSGRQMSLPVWLTRLLAGPIHDFMQSKQLRELKRRVEG